MVDGTGIVKCTLGPESDGRHLRQVSGSEPVDQEAVQCMEELGEGRMSASPIHPKSSVRGTGTHKESVSSICR